MGNVLTEFYRLGAAPKADFYEKGSNACLFFLRSAIGLRSYSIYNQSPPVLFTDTISKAKRVVSAIFAFLLCLPLTLIGLVFLKLSSTHKIACAEVNKPQIPKPNTLTLEITTRSLKDLNEKKSLLNAPFLNHIHLNPDDKEFSDMLVGIVKEFTNKYSDPTQIKCKITVADSKKHIPSNLLEDLSVEETKTLYAMTKNNSGFIKRIVRGLAQDSTSKNKFLDKLEQFDNHSTKSLSANLIAILVALQYAKLPSLETLRELECSNLPAALCVHLPEEIDFLQKLGINTDELIYKLVTYQKENIKNGISHPHDFNLFMDGLKLPQIDALTNYMDMTLLSNYEFLLPSLCWENTVDPNGLQKVIDILTLVFKKAQIADPIATFINSPSNVFFHTCLTVLYKSPSSQTAKLLKKTFSILKADPNLPGQFASKLGKLAIKHDQYMTAIFQGFVEALNAGHISDSPKIIVPLFKSIIAIDKIQEIEDAFYEFFRRFDDGDLFADLLPLIKCETHLRSVCNALVRRKSYYSAGNYQSVLVNKHDELGFKISKKKITAML